MRTIQRPDDRGCTIRPRPEPVPVLIQTRNALLGHLRLGLAYADVMLGTTIMATWCEIGPDLRLRVDPTWLTAIPDPIAYLRSLGRRG